MRKVLVDPAALEEAAKWLEVHSSSSGSAEAFAADALREAIGQPAEAEGVEVVAYGMPNSAPGKAPRMMMVAIDIPGDDQYGGQLWEPLVRQSALSAVTAERDRLRKDAERWRYVSLQGDDTHWLNLLRVDLDDFGGNIDAAVDALIDGEAPAMAAKEAGPEHVCSGCGAKGWTGNCLECIPY